MSEPTEENRPPVFKSWSGWYWLVASVLLIQIIVYTLITNSF
ncbi:MAG TPA: hypothetical protein VFE50_26245 [Cyclobacteriaceae bacterium]|nr:hypothetical protein [Cyclobacteriaceae bacterium]